MVQDSPSSEQEAESRVPLAEGEDWQKRFDGLMSASQKREEAAKREIESQRSQASALQARIAAMESRMTQQAQDSRKATIAATLDPEERMELQLKELQDELVDVRGQLQGAEQQRQTESLQRAGIEMRAQHIKSWTDRGVPQEALDMASPEAMRASALEWMTGEQQKELTETKRKLENLRGREQEVASETEAQVREELGATRVLTSQGKPPASATEKERLETELARALKDRNVPAAFSIKRQLAVLSE